MKFAPLLLLAVPAFGAAVLTDDIYHVPPVPVVRFEIHRQPATVDCSFRTLDGGEARAELVSAADLDLFRHHRSYDELASTETDRSGTFSRYLQEPGEYAVVVESSTSQPVTLHLTVALSFEPSHPISRYLSPQRRLTVILISFAAFFAIVTFSARALLRAMRKP